MRIYGIMLRLDDGEHARAKRLATKAKASSLPAYFRMLLEEECLRVGIKTDERGPERRVRGEAVAKKRSRKGPA